MDRNKKSNLLQAISSLDSGQVNNNLWQGNFLKQFNRNIQNTQLSPGSKCSTILYYLEEVSESRRAQCVYVLNVDEKQVKCSADHRMVE